MQQKPVFVQEQSTVRERKTSMIRQKRSKIQDSLKNSLLLNRKPSQDLQLASQEYCFTIRERSKTYGFVKEVSPLSSQKSQITQFQNLYEFRQKLGQGMHAVVYKCREFKTDRFYAVKRSKCTAGEMIFMIIRAFNLLKVLSHPGIVKAKSLFIDIQSQVCLLVTDLIQKPTLREYIDSVGTRKLTEEKIKKIIIGLLSPLNYLHDRKICHRDIKPENILYDSETNQLFLIDFDIACQQKMTEQKIQMWTDTGSLFYRAPESFQAGYNEKIDVWAVGVIAFELFTGRLPCVKSSKEELIKKLNDHDLIKDLNAALAGASQDFKSLTLKLLTQNPEQRPSMKQAQNDNFLKYSKQMQQSVLTNDQFDSNIQSSRELQKQSQVKQSKAKSIQKGMPKQKQQQLSK